ncbi:metal ABC transporter permease [Candidatus Entotheonella palauensis]|uniref:metal ABC transporter permease n=1 Tax=Candidatus Entotheonella palauensis TaxID=93172 RepID=UPI000B7EC627|nr:metal ABC transporter permease [Candidatus Entotheonella palauensis]
MIESFLDSWELFLQTYLAGWLIALLLSLMGVFVVARDQIFIGIAISQASTLGIALGMGIGSWLDVHHVTWLDSAGIISNDSFLSGMAVLFAIFAALLTARRSEAGGESHEAITGWVFLSSASLSILFVAHSPHGLDEIQRLLSSSLIGATNGDVWTFGVLTGGTMLALAIAHRRLLLFAMDPPMAAAVGMRVTRWSAGTAIWIGLVIGLAMRVSGMLYTFGLLVLPALVAKNVCREVRTVFFVSPMIAISVGTIGFVLANHYDFPPAQMTVALLSGLLTLGWLYQRRQS